MSTRLLAVAVSLLLSSTALAQASARLGDDEIELKSGGMVRGTLVEVTPNNQVTIVIDATGEHRLIPWADIAKLGRGKYAQAQTPVPAPALATAAISERGLVRLHLSGETAGLKLFLTQPLSDDDALVCAAPCDREVDGRGGQDFYLAGEGIVHSDNFKLLAREGGIEMKVRAGSQGARTLSIIGTVAGGAIGFVGLSLFSSGIAPYGQSGVYYSGDTRSRLLVGGGISMLAGAALAIGSLYALSQNQTTFQVREVP